jgi:hypothetical protein
MADFELSESCSRILQESKSIPNPFQNQSKLRTGELRKGLDSWLENMEAEAIASRPLTLALILDMAGKLESIATFLQLHPCSANVQQITRRSLLSSSSSSRVFVLQMLALVQVTFVGEWVTWARYATRLFRRICADQTQSI